MAVLVVRDVRKNFTMHLRGGVEIPVMSGLNFAIGAGECVVLDGPSGAGKSSVLKMIYGTYAIDAGHVLVTEDDHDIDVATADPLVVKRLRRHVIGYVSQFLRVLPRVSARDLVAEPLIEVGVSADEAIGRAEHLLARLNVPQTLWDLPPATFSGGEQQRVNIARGFLTDHPLLLLDEPSASLDAKNRQVVIDLITEKKKAGVAMLGIFHDPEVRDAVADRHVDVVRFSARMQCGKGS